MIVSPEIFENNIRIIRKATAKLREKHAKDFEEFDIYLKNDSTLKSPISNEFKEIKKDETEHT
jgi:hypothetical protein